ncbi:hypothetical protein EAG_11351 [Camponotus floridanus]|uniref:Uncharacterized protein n=1 Tax=Camponotus floridanus TaxID=104421 RepID=E2A105_CAMFO|nr:hypothetical protein EAG_11351 [Camponotus floridanus]
MDGRIVKSQRIALQRGFSAAGKLRQGEACILPSLRGGLPSKATALPHCCSTLAWDRISTGDGRGRAWFLQSTSRPRCGRANAEYDRFVHVSICIPWIPVITPTILSSPRAEDKRPRALRCIPNEVRPNFLVGAPWLRLLARRGRHKQL